MDTTLSDYERLGPDGGPCGHPIPDDDGPNGREGPKNGESAWPVALWGPGTFRNGYAPTGYRLMDRAGYYVDTYDTREGIDWLDVLLAGLNRGGPARERALKQMVRLPPAPRPGAPARGRGRLP